MKGNREIGAPGRVAGLRALVDLCEPTRPSRAELTV